MESFLRLSPRTSPISMSASGSISEEGPVYRTYSIDHALKVMPEIAVIIPTYNRAPSLKRAIESVLAQSLSDIELIVVDDGSEDDTPDVAQTFHVCRYVKIRHSGLPAIARNMGARTTGATYLAFLDSDDEWLPSKLEKQLMNIVEKSYGLVCTNASLNGIRPYLKPDRKHTGWVLGDLVAENFVITSSVVVRRDLFERAGVKSHGISCTTK